MSWRELFNDVFDAVIGDCNPPDYLDGTPFPTQPKNRDMRATFGSSRKRGAANRQVERISSGRFKGAVPVDQTPLIQKQRWKSKGNTFSGYYRTRYGAWRGEIIRRGDWFDVFIWLDPRIPNIERHNRWICFHHISGRKYQINLAHNPADRDPSAIIFYVQKVIGECFTMN